MLISVCCWDFSEMEMLGLDGLSLEIVNWGFGAWMSEGKEKSGGRWGGVLPISNAEEMLK